MASKIEAQLLEVYGFAKRKRGEADQDYFKRIVDVIQDDPDEKHADACWEKLSTPTQAWANAASTASQAEKAIATFGDDGEDETETETARPPRGKAPAKASKAPAKPTKPAKPATAKATKAAKANGKPPKAEKTEAAPATRSRGGGGAGVYAATQTYVVAHPNASTKEIMEALVKKGLDPKQNTVQSVRGHTRDTLLKAQKHHKIDLGATA